MLKKATKKREAKTPPKKSQAKASRPIIEITDKKVRGRYRFYAHLPDNPISGCGPSIPFAIGNLILRNREHFHIVETPHNSSDQTSRTPVSQIQD